MRYNRRRSGSPFIKVVVFIVVAGGLIGGGYFAWHWYKTPQTLDDNPAAVRFNYVSPAVTTPTAPTITNDAGLGRAMNAVNDTNVTSSSVDSTQLGNQAAAF